MPACVNCSAEINEDTKFCPKCGKNQSVDSEESAANKKKLTPRQIVVAVVGVIAVAIAFTQIGGEVSSSSTAEEIRKTITPTITMEKYSRIQNGMSYNEVKQILGEPGVEQSRNKMEGVPGVMESIETVMYAWQNPGGSNMNAMFQNDKLIQKAQFGLE